MYIRIHNIYIYSIHIYIYVYLYLGVQICVTLRLGGNLEFEGNKKDCTIHSVVCPVHCIFPFKRSSDFEGSVAFRRWKMIGKSGHGFGFRPKMTEPHLVRTDSPSIGYENALFFRHTIHQRSTMMSQT